MKSNALFAGLCFAAVFGAVIANERYGRDIGLHGGHHHDHGQKAEASSRSETKGYGRDIPDPALPVSLAEEPKAASQPKGYPRENPANPLKLDPQAATKVEVRVESDAAAQQPMMGGEIPGNAGDDYPIFDSVPETKFNCKDFDFGGYFADVDEGRCQVFHVCHDGRKFSFLCPNGTIFDQKVFVCNWWFNVDCAASKDFYELNKAIGVVPEKQAEKLNTAASTVDQVDAPSAEYLPPPPPAQEAVKAEPPATSYLPPNAVEAISNGLIKAPEPAQEYLPPVEPVVAEPVVVAEPEQSYLPPEAPAAPKAPELEYLPPNTN